jgi:PhnB protein
LDCNAEYDPRNDAYIENPTEATRNKRPATTIEWLSEGKVEIGSTKSAENDYQFSAISYQLFRRKQKENQIMVGVNPYIAFKGNAKEAIDFYKEALNAELLYSQTYGDSPMADMGPADAIMHASIKVGDSTIMVCDDMRPEAAATPGNISLAIGLNDIDTAKTFFDNLSKGGAVTMPLDKTFWAEAFGMLTDKFGINWMVNCDKPVEESKSATT